MIEGIRSLRALSEAREAFLDCARIVQGIESVARVQSALEARSYATGPIIEFFLDVALHDDTAVVAWLDVVPAGDEFLIRPSLRLLNFEGETVHELPERFATTEDEFVGELLGAVRQLLAAFRKVDLAHPEATFSE
jgi:hypothetical protein